MDVVVAAKDGPSVFPKSGTNAQLRAPVQADRTCNIREDGGRGAESAL
jgi:hypothetical protein